MWTSDAKTTTISEYFQANKFDSHLLSCKRAKQRIITMAMSGMVIPT